MLNVLAVDPSLTSTGWATLLHDSERHETGLIHDKVRRHGRTTKLNDPARMLYLAATVRDRARRHEARLVALEGPSMNSRSGSTDRIHGLHWHIRAALWGAGIPYIVVSPSTIKLYATGYGLAPKRTSADRHGHQRAGMLDTCVDDLGYAGTRVRGGDQVLSDDVADAVWLHALVADALGQGYAPDLASPALRQKRRDAVATVVPLLPRAGVLTPPPTTTQEPA